MENLRRAVHPNKVGLCPLSPEHGGWRLDSEQSTGADVREKTEGSLVWPGLRGAGSLRVGRA